MSSPDSDRQLLLAALALQMDFVSREALDAALRAWASDRSRSLADVLSEHGTLAAEDRAALEKLVVRHLARHDADAGKSLAALPVTSPLLDTLREQPNGRTLAPRLKPTASRFRVLKSHAVGGLGEVSVALDEQLGREVALKQIRGQHADDVDSRARFLREAEITGRLEHPGIVPVYGLEADEEGRPRYAMRFIHGDSLEEGIKRFHEADASRRDPTERALTLRRLLSRFVDVCNAIGYAHSRGVIHRDIKPANIMLGEYGETLVVDWGLARVLEHEGETQPYRAIQTQTDDAAPTQQGQVIGTPAYMPPEQARGEQDRVGVASDVFALGATLYALLTGKPLYPGRSDEALVKAATGEVMPARQVNARVPAALAAVCGKALAFRPNDRYASAGELRGEVERWLADEPVRSYREPFGERLSRWSRRHRAWMRAGMVVLLLSALGLAAGLWAVEREREQTAKQRDEAKTNLVRAEKAETEANTHLKQATANLKLAREAIDECYNAATKDKEFQRPRMEKARNLLLRKTLRFYRNFGEIRPDDERLRGEEADQWLRVGHIEQVLGRTAEAKEAYERARSFYRALFNEQPGRAEYQSDLAGIHNNLGVLLRELGLREEALKEHQRSRSMRLKLVEAHPNVPEYQHDLAGTHLNLGVLLRQLGQREEALKEYHQARQRLLKLVATHPTAIEFQQALAELHNNLGVLLADMRKLDEALKAHQQARELLLKLVKAQPDAPESQYVLASTSNNLGAVMADLGHLEEAFKEYCQARDLLQKLVQTHTDFPAYQHLLAGTHSNLGRLLRMQGQLEEAAKEHLHAREMLRKLLEDHPQIPQYQNALAGAHNSLGLVRSELGQREVALEEYRQCLELRLKLCEAHPNVSEYAGKLGKIHCDLGLLLLGAGRLLESLKSYDAAIAVLTELLERQPADRGARFSLRNSYGGRAMARTALNRRDADDDWEQALEFTDASGRSGIRLQRADSRARAGDYRRAVAEAKHLERSEQVPAATLYELACTYAISAKHASEDSTRPLPDREKRAEGYARAALALLKRAADAGYFRDPKNVAHLKKDADLDSLPGRADFAAFLATLEK